LVSWNILETKAFQWGGLILNKTGKLMVKRLSTHKQFENELGLKKKKR